jgi:hypothetical protein
VVDQDGGDRLGLGLAGFVLVVRTMLPGLRLAMGTGRFPPQAPTATSRRPLASSAANHEAIAKHR